MCKYASLRTLRFLNKNCYCENVSQLSFVVVVFAAVVDMFYSTKDVSYLKMLEPSNATNPNS